MRLDQELGTVEPGKLADLVLLDGDPAADISAVRNTALVMKNGILYQPDELYRELGVAPR
jgi:imidazolonepropionase-like amidohydrolase